MRNLESDKVKKVQRHKVIVTNKERMNLVGIGILIGFLIAVNAIFLPGTILQESASANWDFKLIFTILFITNLVFGFSLISLAMILFKDIDIKAE